VAMSLASQIRAQLGRYLDGDISLQEFDAWFVPATWNVEGTNDQTKVDLVYEFLLRFAEFSNGDCSEPELRTLLEPLARAHQDSALTA